MCSHLQSVRYASHCMSCSFQSISHSSSRVCRQPTSCILIKKTKIFSSRKTSRERIPSRLAHRSQIFLFFTASFSVLLQWAVKMSDPSTVLAFLERDHRCFHGKAKESRKNGCHLLLENFTDKEEVSFVLSICLDVSLSLCL